MKEIVEYFSKQGVLFKSLKEINKTSLNTRKKLSVYCSTDIKKNFHSIFKVNQKSRFLAKNAIELVELEARLQVLENHNFKYKHLIRSEATCSKATNYLKERGWKLHYDFV